MTVLGDVARVLTEELRLLHIEIEEGIQVHADLLHTLWVDAEDLFRTTEFRSYGLAVYVGTEN